MTLTGGRISPAALSPSHRTHVLWGPERTEKPVRLGLDSEQPGSWPASSAPGSAPPISPASAWLPPWGGRVLVNWGDRLQRPQ